MFSRARVLLVAITVALFAWMLGYGMGGGFRIGGKVAGDSREEDAAHGSGAAGRKAGLHDGTTRAADDTLSDQITARRIPWTRERLLKTVGSIHQEPDQLHALRFGMKLTEQLGADDFPLALDVLDDAIQGLGERFSFDENDTLRFKLREFAIMHWAELNPEAVAKYLKAQPYHSSSFGGPRTEIAAFCGVWTKSDPTAAFAWAKTLPKEDNEQFSALRAVVKAVARRDVDAAIALTRANSDLNINIADVIPEAVGARDPERIARAMFDLGKASAIHQAAGAWEKKDHDAALKWAQELPEGDLRQSALEGVLSQFALEHPNEAAAWLSEQPADGPAYLGGPALNVAAHLSFENIDKATQWVASLKQPDAREAAILQLALTYSADWNFDAGLKWLDTLPSGKVRDKAIRNLVENNRNRREARVEVAATIEDGEIRQRTLQKAFNDWSSSDLTAAREWLQNSPKLSDEERQALLKKK